jgi:hypothetical protein
MFALSACANTRTSTEVAPARGTRPFARVVVVMNTFVGPPQTEAESIFAALPAGSGTQLIPSAAVALPRQRTSDSALRALLEVQAIDGVLIIRLAGAGADVAEVRHHTSMCTAGTPTQCLNTVQGGPTTWDTRGSRLSFRATLWDATTLNPIWVGRTDVYRNGSKDGPFLPTLARQLVEALRGQKLLLPPPSGP